MDKNDRIYGLGETLGTLNKRGKKYRFYSTDDPMHTPEKEALYGTHPFMIVDGKNTFGLFIDFPAELIFDIGYENINTLKITVTGKNFDLYIFENENKNSIIEEFLKLTGTPFLPPKWAFGFQQCRWSYPDKESVNNIADNFRKREIPCDAIYLDIDYMENYKIFTVDNNKFPDFPQFARDIMKRGFKLVPIIDPGVKIEDGYNVCDEGVKNGYFCKDKDGKDYVTAVWPGLTYFPDFLNSTVRNWWGNLYKDFNDIGIRAFWNDMNEPAIFYTPDSLKEVSDILKQNSGNTDLGIEAFTAKDKMLTMANNRNDYKSFYQKDESGNIINHDDVHNLYGFNMARGTAEGLMNLDPEKRYFLLSRSSYIGQQRFSYIWMGDNFSWWDHMQVHFRMLQSLNMCGFFYTGPDIGGFGGNSSPELVIRWMQLGAFTPLYRNHSAIGTRNQEPWVYDEESNYILKNIIRLRYAFMPYAYSEFKKSTENLSPFIKPLGFVFETDRAKDAEDQYMYGDSLMVAPVYTPNARGRYVHLPEVKWLKWTASKFEDRNMTVYDPGDYFIDANLNEIPLFIKENSLIVLENPKQYTGEKETENLYITGLVTEESEFTFYDDDGESTGYKNGEYYKINIKISKTETEFDVNVEIDDTEEYPCTIKNIFFEIYDETGKKYTMETKID